MSPTSFRLVVRRGPHDGKAFDLDRDALSLGRDVGNDIVIADAEVSRKHARFSKAAGGFLLEDLGSTNGTFVNGERLEGPRMVNPGDEISLGESVVLVLEAVGPEEMATVGTPAKRVQFPEEEAAEPEAALREAAAISPEVEEPKRKRASRPWLSAGCGCATVVAACLGLLWFVDWYQGGALYGYVVPLLQAVGLYEPLLRLVAAIWGS